MNALVTGAAGFVGSHLVDALLADGATVVGIDNLSTGNRDNLLGARGKPFSFYCADVRELAPRWLRGMDVVFHLAAAKKAVSVNDPVRDLQTNGLGTLLLLDVAATAGVKKFVHVSTGSVYGEARGHQDEEHPLNPVSLYGVSKLAGEKYAMAFRNLRGLNVTVLRYFHVYGPRQDGSQYGGVVPIFIRQMLAGEPLTIHGDGEQQRSFTFVGDVVNVTRWAAQEHLDGQVFNVASGLKVTINDLAAELGRIAGRELPAVHCEPLPGDVRVFDVDHHKLVQAGYRAHWTPFEEGLRRTVEWYKARGAAPA